MEPQPGASGFRTTNRNADAPIPPPYGYYQPQHTAAFNNPDQSTQHRREIPIQQAQPHYPRSYSRDYYPRPHPRDYYPSHDYLSYATAYRTSRTSIPAARTTQQSPRVPEITFKDNTPEYPSGSSNTFLNCLKDCARSVQLSNVVPALTLFGAAAIHHFGNGKADRMVPFSEQRWYKRINNLIFAYALYDTAKSNGVISSPSSASANNIRGFSMDSSDTATGQEFASRLHNIASSLFLTGPDSQEQFDVRWAVRMNEAEQNYHEIYTEDANILNYDVYAMGGAAATKALCDEPELQNRAPLFPQQSYNHRLTLMGTALLEAERLLDRKSAHGSLSTYETLDNVGRIAIATLIKIKDNLV